MFVSHFDQMSHAFRCQNVKCRKVFQIVLRDLLKADHVTCPECRQKMSIEDSKKKGALRKDFDAAQNLDIAERRKEKG